MHDMAILGHYIRQQHCVCVVSNCLIKLSNLSLSLIIPSPMELGSIIHFLQDKTILVTGATGFLAKSLSQSLSLSVTPSKLAYYASSTDTNTDTDTKLYVCVFPCMIM